MSALARISASGRTLRNVRFTPESRHWLSVSGCPLSANSAKSGLDQVQCRCEFLKIGYQACVDQHAIEAACFSSIGAAVK